MLYICSVDYTMIGEYSPLMLKGLGSTVAITLLSLLVGTILGGVVYAMGFNRRRWVREVAKWHKIIVRGTPVMVLLLLVFYVILQGGNGYVAAVAAFGINFSNFACSVIQTSVSAVGREQVDAARALGLTNIQTLRYVIAPQAIRTAMPPFKYNAVALLKSTAVVGYVALPDLTQATQTIRESSGETLLPLICVTLVYFVLAWLLCKLLDFIVKATDRI